ncbi:ketopantoate reductase family protein [Spelaeicoccus albus]|uniref:2-dehydropantoate 2-reductase n=1 Tax=Spelaeicoccus albus TaxID=1280376 RepID=A0A7Z0AA91_9MICO|nr:2-dehydropantoate 2-reductase N-terminal domain-containing protein [Spelaeicoccus albus]NYI65953.1 2-dehydropantoate 2-reductase [Spelaeicoccus albus]
MNRYIIIGAGAIGGTLAARLTEHGREVVAVARGEHGRAIGRRGLTLRSPDDTVTVRPKVAASPSEVRLRTSDVLVLAVKTQQAGAALAEWADVRVVNETGDDIGAAGDLLPIATALNGVHADELAARYFTTVIAACVLLPAVFLQPGEVMVRVAPVSGGFIVGSPLPGPLGIDEAASTAVETIRRDWTSATFEVLPVPNVMDWKYTKLVSNLANAPQALLGPDSDELSAIVELASTEGARVLDEAGIARVSGAERERMRTFISGVRPVPGQPDSIGGSTWQSLRRGTALESDFLNGEIVAVAHRHGRRAPVNAALARLARTASARGLRPGQTSAAAIRAAIGEAAGAETAGRADSGSAAAPPVAD